MRVVKKFALFAGVLFGLQVYNLREVSLQWVPEDRRLRRSTAGPQPRSPSPLHLAVVRPFAPSDAKDLAASFNDWRTFSPCKRANDDGDRPYEVDLFLSISQTFEAHPESARTVMEAIEASRDNWGACFGAVYTLNGGIPVADDVYTSSNPYDPMWVNGPNTQFRQAVRDVKAQHQYDAMFLMEADTIPYKEFWLDQLADEILMKQPFAILGSKFHGCTWSKALRKKLPIALLNHFNGNAVYNVSHPLFNLVLDELESEVSTDYKTQAYDYRISQILTEASLGDFPYLPFEGMPLSTNTAKFRSWWQKFGGEGGASPVKESALIKNFAKANFLSSEVGESTAIVHGKMKRNDWNPDLHNITLVVSDSFNGNAEKLLSNLNSVNHPFSEVVLMRRTRAFATDRDDVKNKPKIPVTIYDRGDSHSYMDLCTAPVSTDWFLITDSQHNVEQDVKLFFTSDGMHTPVVPYLSADDDIACMKTGKCGDVVRTAKKFYEDADKFVFNSELLFHTLQRDSFCEKWMQTSHTKEEGPTATTFIAYLQSLGIADLHYSFSDRYLHGSFQNFVRASRQELLDNKAASTRLPFSEFIANVPRNSSAQVDCGEDFAVNCAECPKCHGQCKMLLTNSTTREGKCVTRSQFEEASGCGIVDKVEPLDPSNLDVNCDNINEVTIGQLLGTGANKIVYEGYWKGRVYAVKMRKPSSHRLQGQNFPPVDLTLKEAALLHGLRRQPNIIPLVGFCDGVALTEIGQPLEHFAYTGNLTPKTRVQYALDIARSIDQIHSIPGGLLLHGDLAFKQYLLLESGTLVLGDLDTVKYVGDERCRKPTSGDNPNMAPEQLAGIAEGRLIDEKADIYALGNMIWSLLSKEYIFQYVDRQELPAKILNGLRPDVTKVAGYPQSITEVLLECWALAPESRPTASHVVARIQEALSSME